MKHSPQVHKTNAARLLDSLSIRYELRAYEVDPEDLTAISVAKKINMPLEQVFKTLLTRTSDPRGPHGAPAPWGGNTRGPHGAPAPRDGNTHLFAVIPGDAELDLKKLAALAGVRKTELTALKDVEPLTGYIRGGVTVLSAKRPFPAFADETIELFD